MAGLPANSSRLSCKTSASFGRLNRGISCFLSSKTCWGSMASPRRQSLRSMSAVLLLLFVSEVAFASTVNGVRLWRAPDHTRVVFDLSAPVEHKLFSLKQPNRLVIDVDQSAVDAASFAGTLAKVNYIDSPITNIRHGKRGANGLRVVFDLESQVKPRSFVLKKHLDKPDRLVIDLYDATKKAEKPAVEEKVAAPVVSRETRDIVIAIDAGHGGEDPGALGPKRIQEKDVVLKISKQLEKMVNAEPGFKAQMVRTGDYYIPLKTRSRKARESRADLFVSIHADAFTNPKAHGASVFALSNRGATSESARFLASKENEADLIGGVGGVSLGDKDDILASVLVDLSMTSTLASSLEVGAKVLNNIGGVARLHKKHVEQAAFVVLKSPDVPSILVETGFISNPGEARKLGTASYQRKMARAIFKGLKTHFHANPPEGSYLAFQKTGGGKVKYKIARGDTLSGIAKKYRVSVASLKKVNRIDGSTIKIGQVLTIPAT